MKQLNLIGVDISESSIKVLQLDEENNIFAYGTAPLESGIVVNGRITNFDAFSTVLGSVLKNTKPQALDTEKTPLRAVISLPETKLFSYHCIIPDNIDDKDLSEYVYNEAKTIIPFELDTLYFNYHIATEDGVRNATFSGVAKTDLENYVKAFTQAKVRPVFIGGELFSLGWALLPKPPLVEDYIIVDMGAHSTTIGIYGVDAVANLSILAPLGGDYLTQALVEELGLTPEVAEQKKREYGVGLSGVGEEVGEIIKKNLKQITDKITEAKLYFEAKTGNPIRHIILAGGSALLPQVKDFISEKIGIEVQLANPFLKIKGHEHLGEEIPSLFYTNVIGLALCATQEDFSHLNLLTQYRYDDKVERETILIQDIKSLAELNYFVRNYLLNIKTKIISLGSFFKKIITVPEHNLKLLLTVLFFILAVTLLIWVISTNL